MEPFHELLPCDLNPVTLREEIHSRGYVLIRGLLPVECVRSALADVTHVLSEAGWLIPSQDSYDHTANPEAACGDPDPTFKRVYQQIFNLESLHALPHHSRLQWVMQMLAGEHLLVHPKPIVRLIFPACERLVTHPHQDYEFMGGDPEFYTVWIPLHDCPINVGPLRILEGSHKFGIQYHDRENLHVPEIQEERALGGQWLGGHVNAGDLLIFHSLTVHAASPNLSDQLRISLDCRFQDVRRAINPAAFAFAGESGKSWETTYAAWRSEELQFYWKQLPLTYQPTKPELAHLARTAPISMRAKYARILAQLD